MKEYEKLKRELFVDWRRTQEDYMAEKIRFQCKVMRALRMHKKVLIIEPHINVWDYRYGNDMPFELRHDAIVVPQSINIQSLVRSLLDDNFFLNVQDVPTLDYSGKISKYGEAFILAYD
jgi:hypothetical protein